MPRSAEMVHHIPFVHTSRDCDLLRRFYSDSPVVRVPLPKASQLTPKLPDGCQLWLDPSIDAFHSWPPSDDGLREFLSEFGEADKIGDPSFQNKPHKNDVRPFVDSVLDACGDLKPRALTIPQIPMVDDASRNKINRLLAECAGEWKRKRKYRGRFVLPVILTHQRQANRKTQRNKKIDLVSNCYYNADADGVWVVDSTLNDQRGSMTYRRDRFPGIIAFHEELVKNLPDTRLSIAGPYWGLNIVLWARGLVNYAAIGVGGGYQYHIPHVIPKQAKKRIALPAIRRTAVLSVQLEAWLEKALEVLPKNDDAYKSVRKLTKDFNRFMIGHANRVQIASFYKTWLNEIGAANKKARTLALYQDLSKAYVVGKILPDLPKDESPGRRAERVAEQLMLICL